MRKFYIIPALISFVIGVPALSIANDNKESLKSETKIESDSEGNYERKTNIKEDDAKGTTRTESSKVKIKTDSEGNTEKTTEVEKTTDPKGLLNTKSEKVTDTVKTKDGKQKYHHKKKVDGKVVEEKTIENKK